MTSKLTLASIGLALLLAAPAASVAEGPAAAGAVGGAFATSAIAAASHWTPARRRGATPLETLVLAGGSGKGAAPPAQAEPPAPAYVPATSPGAEAADPRRGALVTTAAVEGVEAGPPTAFPNSANGVVLGEYRTPSGNEPYRCSGSVISSPAGDVVLTAGHCVLDPETGTVASYLVFIPGYREGAEPYGEWAATEYATTEQWEMTAGSSEPDEAGDVAMLKLAGNGAGASPQSTVGALGIAFNQPRAQTYTQYGYPAEKPYDGELLYSHTAAYAGGDSSFAPATMKIASDFTAGSSGGPWTVSSGGTPVALSVTDYGYESHPGYLYGPYFGSLVERVYELITTGSSEPAAPAAAGSQPVPTSISPAATQSAPVWLRLLGLSRDRGAGTATLRVAVSGPGVVRLSGARVWSSSRRVRAATTLAVTIRAKGAAASELRAAGSVAVGVRLAFSAAGDSVSRSRLLRLSVYPTSTASRSGSP